MAIEKKRMMQRRGSYSNFNPLNALPQEFQIVTEGDPNTDDGKAIYIVIEAGVVRRLVASNEIQGIIDATYQEVLSDIAEDIAAAESATAAAATAANYALVQGQNAETAANSVYTFIEDIENRIELGEFTGPPGPQGQQGVAGKDGQDGVNGVVVTISGQFAMQIQNGHLYVIYPDGGVAPNMEINSDGHLLWSY